MAHHSKTSSSAPYVLHVYLPRVCEPALKVIADELGKRPEQVVRELVEGYCNTVTQTILKGRRYGRRDEAPSAD